MEQGNSSKDNVVNGKESPMEPVTCLRDLLAWLQAGLTHNVAYVPVPSTIAGAHHPHGWTAVRFADWDVRQKIAEIQEALNVAEMRNEP